MTSMVTIDAIGRRANLPSEGKRRLPVSAAKPAEKTPPRDDMSEFFCFVM